MKEGWILKEHNKRLKDRSKQGIIKKQQTNKKRVRKKY